MGRVGVTALLHAPTTAIETVTLTNSLGTREVKSNDHSIGHWRRVKGHTRGHARALCLVVQLEPRALGPSSL